MKYLVDAGALIRHCGADGHSALLTAVHHRDVARDSRRLELLQLLISYRVPLNTVTRYQESALRVLSRLGRFEAIKLLLDAGADSDQPQWTALHHATALGDLADVQRLLEEGNSCEEQDWWVGSLGYHGAREYGHTPHLSTRHRDIRLRKDRCHWRRAWLDLWPRRQEALAERNRDRLRQDRDQRRQRRAIHAE